MKKLENTNGVTLIVLVITIVVLLILATVSINLLSGENGIIAKAQKVSEDAKRVEIIENVKSALAAEEAENPDEPLTIERIEKVLNEHGTVNKTEDGVFKSFTSEEIEIPIQEFIEEDVDLELAYFAIPGDYVEYNDGLWRVLYNDSNNGLQIILDGVGDEFTVSPGNYDNAVDLLNEACQKYINTELAYSARSVGTNPITSIDTTTQTITVGDNAKGNTITCKVGDSNYMTDASVMKECGVIDVGKEYWLASRSMRHNTGEYWSFYAGVRCVTEDGNASYDIILDLHKANPGEMGGYYGHIYNNYTVTLPIRPVVTLKSSVMIGSGDGTKDNPFTLSK